MLVGAQVGVRVGRWWRRLCVGRSVSRNSGGNAHRGLFDDSLASASDVDGDEARR